MLKENNNILRKVQMALDACITGASFFLAYFIRNHGGSALIHHLDPLPHYLFLLYIILPLWIILISFNGGYDSIRCKGLAPSLWPACKSVLMGGCLLMATIFVFKLELISRGLIFLFIFVNILLLTIYRTSLYFFFQHIRRKGRNFRKVLIIGTGPRAQAFAGTVQSHPEWGIKVEGFLDIEPAKVGHTILGAKVLGVIDDLQKILTESLVDEMVFVGPRSWHQYLDRIIVLGEDIGISTRIACDFNQKQNLTRINFNTLDRWPLLTIMPPPHYGELYTVKRALDIAFSGLVLVVLSPVLLVVALAIKLTSPGPVLFKQERCGLNGRRFMLLKFRTMTQDAESQKTGLEHLNVMSGPVFKIKSDPRVTAVGGFLRKFSLDEFPQFINVLRGDMSIVGPRPPLPQEVERYDYSQRRRLSVRPGLTCLWQVKGRNKIGFYEWVKLDLEYIDNWSISLDLKIILKTVPAVLKGSGL